MLCCLSSKKIDNNERKDPLSDGDYLLPGGEWDPSVSRRGVGSNSVSTNSGTSITSSLRALWTRRLRGKKRYLRTPDGEKAKQESGDYQPPPLAPSRTLPTFDEFKLLKTVGRGAFGKVMLAVHCETRILYALKVVPKAKITTQKQVEQILAESKILKNIRHPFCVALQYAFQNDDFLFYVFEFAAGGMLFYHLRKDGKFSEPRARFYFGEIILALDYLHSFGIIFRDLKPENCLLSERGHIVLSDFGSAKMLEVAEKTSTIAGTPQYIAPEVLRGEPYSFSADWWSCGVLLYEMLTGRTPFASADRVELYKLVLWGYFTVPKSVSPRAKSLLYRLISKNQDQRIGCSCGTCQFHSASDIKQHKFFSQMSMDSEEESRYAIEDAEMEWLRQSVEKQRRSRSSSILNVAGSFIRTVSISAKNISMALYMGVPCEWTWEELESREVLPPFKPKLASPTDLRHFDPTLTCIPPSLSDLITTDRSLHVGNFDYVAPQDVPTIKAPKKFLSECNEMVATTCVKVVGAEDTNNEPVLELENSTDEEKVLKSDIGVVGSKGKLLKEKFDNSDAPFFTKVLVTADINPQ